MKHIQFFEAFNQDIEWEKSTSDKMTKSLQRKQGTSTELLPQINNLTKNFDEKKFTNFFNQLRQEAVKKFGTRPDNPYQSYLQDIRNRNQSLTRGLINLFEIALDKIDKKNNIYTNIEEMNNYLLKK